VLFAAMCVIWGLPYLLIRICDGELSATAIVFLRTAIGALLLLPFCVFNGQLKALRGHWRPLLAYTVVEVTVPWWLLTNAERHISSSLAGLIVAAVPLIGVVVNRLSGGTDRVDARRGIGLAVGLLGVGLLVGLQVGTVDGWAIASVLLLSVGYAVGPIILSRHMSELPGPAIVATSLAITAVVYAPFATRSWPSHVTGDVITCIVVLAVVCTAAAFLVFFALIRDVGPTRATVITYVNPAVALLLGVAVLSEHITVGMAVGFPLVLAGSVLASRGGAVESVATSDTPACAADPCAADPSNAAVSQVPEGAMIDVVSESAR
jgi:drug/metabolite transporter (DMT)-like permease